jgi:hypothetical protein
VKLVIRLLSIAILFLCSSGLALADGNCPDGYFPIGGGNAGWEGCAPYEVPAGDPPPDPGPQWATRWGAIAVDGQVGRFGGVEGMSSEGRARRSAIKLCRKNGGKKCDVIATYYNQCGAMAWGDNRAASYSGPEREKTINLAVAECSTLTPNCKPYYAGCSYPQRIR